jgi:hypothetical protein
MHGQMGKAQFSSGFNTVLGSFEASTLPKFRASLVKAYLACE